ncbi:MAG: hypothetical protein HN904_03500 [Victivallales bacterium]|nr:hypothetical protein [Victivallales bacterium]
MSSSTSNSDLVPLLGDIRKQRPEAARFARLLLLFLALLFAVDRLFGFTLERGLERYFGLDSPAQVLCIGHSHTVLGIDKTGLEDEVGVPVAKYARQGANAENRLVMLRHYLERQPGSVKIMVYDVDAHTFTSAGLSANSHRLFYPFLSSPAVRGYVSQSAASPLECGLRRLVVASRFSEVTLALSARGWLRKWTNFKVGSVDVERLQKQIAAGDIRPISFDEDAIRVFEETLREAQSHDIHVVLTLIPTLDILNDAQPEAYAKAVRMFGDYAADNPHVTFLDYNPGLSHRHELFYDAIHMNPAGQRQVTERLGRDLALILADSDGQAAKGALSQRTLAGPE